MVDLIHPTIDMSTEDRVKDLLKVNNLVKHFPVRGGILKRVVAWVQAVDDVSFTIREGETLCLVGESGCGKSTVGNCILRLIKPTSGTVEINGDNIYKLNSKELKIMRRNMQVIFQDPYSPLNPPQTDRRFDPGWFEDSQDRKRSGTSRHYAQYA